MVKTLDLTDRQEQDFEWFIANQEELNFALKKIYKGITMNLFD